MNIVNLLQFYGPVPILVDLIYKKVRSPVFYEFICKICKTVICKIRMINGYIQEMPLIAMFQNILTHHG